MGSGGGFGGGDQWCQCQICFKPGHTALVCNQRFNQGFVPDQCQICFKTGHTAAVCDHRYNRRLVPETSAPQAHAPPQNRLPPSLFTSQYPSSYPFGQNIQQTKPFEFPSRDKPSSPPFNFFGPPKSSQDEKNQIEVALNMTKHLFSKQEYHDKNLVFSPLSLYTVLSIIAAGSEGLTLHQLLTFLRSDSTDQLNSSASQLASTLLSDDATLSFANGVFADQSVSISSSFKQVVATCYKANVDLLDFSKGAGVTHKVNSLVEKDTKGLIKELLPPGLVDRTTRLILVNALHFKGVWKNKFDALITNNYDFHLLNGTSVQVPFMVSNMKKHFIGAFNGFKVLRLPYTHRFSMYIFLPDLKNGLSALMEKMTSESEFLEHNLPQWEVDANCVRIPRFKISFGLETSHVLKDMGLVLPFDQKQAELTNMAKMINSYEERLYVKAIFHKAFIEINEEGTKAAAAAGAQICAFGSMPMIDFVADHPFIFMIREDLTGVILFIGQMLNPLEGGSY